MKKTNIFMFIVIVDENIASALWTGKNLRIASLYFFFCFCVVPLFPAFLSRCLDLLTKKSEESQYIYLGLSS